MLAELIKKLQTDITLFGTSCAVRHIGCDYKCDYFIISFESPPSISQSNMVLSYLTNNKQSNTSIDAFSLSLGRNKFDQRGQCSTPSLLMRTTNKYGEFIILGISN